MNKYGVKAVVRVTGLNENTLRAWERRYQAVQPERDAEGRRLYSEKELEKLQLLSNLVREGHTIGRIANLPINDLKQMLKTSLSPEATVLNATDTKKQNHLREIIRALEEFDLQHLNQSLQRARFEMGQKEIIMNLVRPLLKEVGLMVNTGKLSISQEHLLSSLLRDFLGNMHQSLTPYDFASKARSKSVILTTREGDIHEFSILMSAILCNLYRYKTYYLGPNMPAKDLIEAVLHLKIDTLVVGMMPLPKEKEIISPVDFLKELDKELPRNVTFCIGGSKAFPYEFLRKDRRVVLVESLMEIDEFFSRES